MKIILKRRVAEQLVHEAYGNCLMIIMTSEGKYKKFTEERGMMDEGYRAWIENKGQLEADRDYFHNELMPLTMDQNIHSFEFEVDEYARLYMRSGPMR